MSFGLALKSPLGEKYRLKFAELRSKSVNEEAPMDRAFAYRIIISIVKEGV